MSDTSRLTPSAVQRRATAGAESTEEAGGVPATETEAMREELHGDNYAASGLTQPPLVLAGQPPVPDAPAPRGMSLRSGGLALRAQALRAGEEAGSPLPHATRSSLAARSSEGDEMGDDGIATAVAKAYAMMGRSSAEDEARHQRTQAADIAKAIRAGHRHIDDRGATIRRSDRLERAGITEGSKNPAVRLAQLHRASEPGWTGGASDAVSETLQAASQAATGGLPAFAVGRRDLQG